MREVTYMCLKDIESLVSCLYFIDSEEPGGESGNAWRKLTGRALDRLQARIDDPAFLNYTINMAQYAVGAEYYKDYANPNRQRHSYFRAIELLRYFGFPAYVYLVLTQGLIEAIYAVWNKGKPTKGTDKILNWFLEIDDQASDGDRIVRSIRDKFWNRLKHLPELGGGSDSESEPVYNVHICPFAPDGRELTSIYETVNLRGNEILVINPDLWIARLNRLIQDLEDKQLIQEYGQDIPANLRAALEIRIESFQDKQSRLIARANDLGASG